MRLPASLAGRGRAFWVVAGCALLAAVGSLDFLTGPDISFSVFYLVPVSAVTWFVGRRPGVAAAIASAVVWLVVDVAEKPTPLTPVNFAWNALVRFGFFVIVALLLSSLRASLARQRELASKDQLTGAANSRAFVELVQSEIERAKRYGRPFTVAYLDLDDFKAVNDRFGHAFGDQVLRDAVQDARAHLRKTDVIARIGGDEFALLMPETDGESAQVAVSKIQRAFVERMKRDGLPTTVSIGVVTCVGAPREARELIRAADDLMYSAKRGGKNTVRYRTYAA